MDSLKKQAHIKQFYATLSDEKSLFSGVDENLSYDPRPYKIRHFYRTLYDCSISVMSKSKNSFTNALLIEQIGLEQTANLSRFHFNELIETMINELKNEIEKTSIDDVKVLVFSSERTGELQSVYGKKYENSFTLQTITFRIPKHVVSDIRTIKSDRLGETIELAILYYLIKLDDLAYQFIKSALKYSE